LVGSSMAVVAEMATGSESSRGGAGDVVAAGVGHTSMLSGGMFAAAKVSRECSLLRKKVRGISSWHEVRWEARVLPGPRGVAAPGTQNAEAPRLERRTS
jgi:hypothetical protein